MIAQWIAAGTPAPADWDPVDDPPRGLSARGAAEARGRAADRRPRALLRRPRRRRDALGQVLHRTRGRSRRSSDDGVAKVQGPGEAAISAWYLSRIVTARITSPFPNRIDPAVYARAPRANFIDGLVLTKLQELNIEPSPLSSDTEFIRRAYLDAAGILPDAGRGPRVPGGHAPRQARAPDRRAARASGVRRLLGLQVVRPAARLEQEPAVERDVVVLQLDPRERGRQQAVGPDGPRDPHRLGQHARERRGQLLRPAQEPD